MSLAKRANHRKDKHKETPTYIFLKNAYGEAKRANLTYLELFIYGVGWAFSLSFSFSFPLLSPSWWSLYDGTKPNNKKSFLLYHHNWIDWFAERDRFMAVAFFLVFFLLSFLLFSPATAILANQSAWLYVDASPASATNIPETMFGISFEVFPPLLHYLCYFWSFLLIYLFFYLAS